MKILQKIIIFLICFGLLSSSVYVSADEIESKQRARLRMSSSEKKPSEPVSEKISFDWENLGKFGQAAAGKNPVIGQESGKSYYSFPDGQPHPYYVKSK